MNDPTTVQEYKWDIAISLCKQDSEFARKLVKAINSSLKIFFYEDRQEELISKSGPEAFAKVFKEEARVVVLLSRDQWSNSYYTEIERNAIIDRTAIKNQGYEFLMVIPMMQGEVPAWYPSTYIYVDPFKFPIDQIAKFIEFKLIGQGGKVVQLTVEDRYKLLLQRIDLKKTVIRLQSTETAIQCANDEKDALKIAFNKKLSFFRNNVISKLEFYEFGITNNKSRISLGEYFLECKFILHDEYYFQIETTQDMVVKFEIFTLENTNRKKIIDNEIRIFYYTHEFSGWALPVINEREKNNELQILFQNRYFDTYYDLQNSIETRALVDKWFQKFLSISTSDIERHI